jgi:ribose transport system permease protein
MDANRLRSRALASPLLADYGMLAVLLLLCAALGVATLNEQHPTGLAAARQLADTIARDWSPGAQAAIVLGAGDDDAAFAAALEQAVRGHGIAVLATVRGQPADARRALARLGEQGVRLDVIACNRVTSAWGVYDPLRTRYPSLKAARIVTPRSFLWPDFFKADNLRNIANQIDVIAILAIGMTLVIITGGIDLSVGSLIALSAVVTARMIRDVAGAESASTLGMVLAGLAGVSVCAAVGMLSGTIVTLCRVPPFIVTLAKMLVASGLAYKLADGQSINRVPERFVWLGGGADVLRIPNAVLLMLALYALAHVMMTRMVIGRYIYAVGGNAEAARLSGVPVRRVLLFVYTLCGGLAGLGGVVMASQLKSGAPNFGQTYELSVIAAVVVGGTSLAGGQGKILGTLIGVLIIAVIQNGMNLLGVDSFTQKIMLGLVILGAVLLDRLRRGLGR